MATASLNLIVVEKRMLTPAEGAAYAGIPIKYFRLECPVSPIEVRPGKLLYDKRDLDSWIDGMKSGSVTTLRSAILGRL